MTGNVYGNKNFGMPNSLQQSPIESLNKTVSDNANPSSDLYERGEVLARVVQVHENRDPDPSSSPYPYAISCEVSDLHFVEDSADSEAFDITLLPIFYPIPSLYFCERPVAGEIVRVRFDDISNKNIGTYHGRFSGQGSKVDLSPVLKLFPSYQAASIIPSALSSLFGKDKKELPENCYFDQNGDIKTSYSGCGGEEEKTPGEKTLTIRGIGEVKKNFILYANAGGQHIIPDYMEKALDAMTADMKNQIGVDLIINSTFRSEKKQQCFYDRYKTCLDEWKARGSKPPQPPPAARPPNNGVANNSHLAGNAVDFSTGTQITDVYELGSDPQGLEKAQENARRGKYSKVFNWLVLNSYKYGFTWTGRTAREPWHFSFSEQQAKRRGY